MLTLVTGHASFIGFHAALRLLERGDAVVGFDNVSDHGDLTLKEARLAELADRSGTLPGRYISIEADLTDAAALARCFDRYRFERVIHLAARPGIAFSVAHPDATVAANIVGFANLLEACRVAAVPHLTYASSSSVYGASRRLPYSEHDPADHPLQLYAATKRANELMAHAYSHLYALPTTGLRFFTVYGPWCRPDLALYKFVEAICAGRPVELMDAGRHSRDFTYVDDLVTALVALSDDIARPDPNWRGEAPDAATSSAPWRVLNIGSDRPARVTDYLDAIEAALGQKAIRRDQPRQAADMPDTWADLTEIRSAIGYEPSISLDEGVARFVAWYRSRQ